jgi:ArsR family transcriptional regulator
MREVLVFAKCFGDPLSVQIISLLRGNELCVCEINLAVDKAGSRVDTRLRALVRAGVIRVRRRDGWPAYRLATRYTDIVETLFEAFDSDLAWDPEVTANFSRLKRRLVERQEGWCVPKGSSPAQGAGL